MLLLKLIYFLLKENYRSTQAILDASKNLIDLNKLRIINQLQSLNIEKSLVAKGENSVSKVQPKIVEYPNRLHEIVDLAKRVASIEEQLEKLHEKTDKSIDLMEVQTKAGHDLGKKFYLTGLLNLRSQFTDGFAYPNDSVPISKFLAPGYVALSIGIDWKPTKSFSLYFSPVSSRLTIVADQEIADAVVGGSSLWGNLPATYDSEGVLVAHSKKVRFEYGMALVATYYGDIAKNVTVGTKLQLFENHLITEPEQIDVIWDFLMNMKVNKWLTASVSATLIYDQDIPITELNPDGSLKFDENGNVVAGPRVQFNESLGVGLMYRFGQQVD